MKSQALASLRAYLISYSVASGFENLRFSSIVVLNKIGSWPTYPMAYLNDVRLYDFKSIPSNLTEPESGS